MPGSVPKALATRFNPLPAIKPGGLASSHFAVGCCRPVFANPVQQESRRETRNTTKGPPNPCGNRPDAGPVPRHQPVRAFHLTILGPAVQTPAGLTRAILAASSRESNAFPSQANFDFLIGLPRFVRADPNRHFPVEASQKFE